MLVRLERACTTLGGVTLRADATAKTAIKVLAALDIFHRFLSIHFIKLAQE